MLRFNLKNAMLAYEAKTGIHLKYEDLAEMTGISSDTLKSIATRPGYNATFKMISEVSKAMNLNPIEFFEWEELDNDFK